MIFYRVIAGDLEDTCEQTVGRELRRLHRTEQSAQQAMENMDFEWNDDWGVKPILEVSTEEYETEAEAIEDGFTVINSCDKCGDAGDLHYYGGSEYGQTGICNACMINKMVMPDGRLADQ